MSTMEWVVWCFSLAPGLIASLASQPDGVQNRWPSWRGELVDFLVRPVENAAFNTDESKDRSREHDGKIVESVTREDGNHRVGSREQEGRGRERCLRLLPSKGRRPASRGRSSPTLEFFSLFASIEMIALATS
ncbi:uncharacterized protein BJX67DRAFT_127689 [Aspergillus lucknowensis]|uniref:Secreted protein n=1 Tax=Aspergillus lucknowensis TaxID=176173 RepID=A0ABR4LQP8_9EURO